MWNILAPDPRFLSNGVEMFNCRSTNGSIQINYQGRYGLCMERILMFPDGSQCCDTPFTERKLWILNIDLWMIPFWI